MRKLFLGLPVFITAFVFGYVTAHSFLPRLGEVMPTVAAEPSAPIPEPPAPVKQPEFVPPAQSAPIKNIDLTSEFRDLPNFIEIPNFRVKLVDVFEYGNDFRRDEIPARSGEKWIGLFEHYGVASVRSVTVRIDALPARSGYGNGIDTALRLPGQKGVPVFILKNIHLLKTGTVTSLYHRPSSDEITKRNLPIKSMALGYNEKFYLGDKVYDLRVAPGTTQNGREVNVLILELDGVRQILTYNLHYDEYDNIGDLLWVGDLDGDGKLDLYFDDYGYEIGGFGSNLFLSSEAAEGQLVKQVASFTTAGC